MFQATSDADRLGSQLRDAAAALVDLEDTSRRAGELVGAAPPPRRTGALGAGVTVAAIPGGAAVFSTARYFTFVHYGAPRRHVRAQPWLAVQLDSNQDRVLDLYAEHASDALALVKG